MTVRLTIVLALAAATTTLARAPLRHAEHAASNLDALPFTIGEWAGHNAPVLDEETLRILNADAYLMRSYTSDTHEEIGVYAAHYSRQQPGVSIHSPLHCLPGTGWEPVDVTTRMIEDAGRGQQMPVRRLIVRKDGEQAMVFYWYAIHGRTVASELASKWWLLHDSVRFGRSDATLIRVSVPIKGTIESAESDGLSFTRKLIPLASHLWS